MFWSAPEDSGRVPVHLAKKFLDTLRRRDAVVEMEAEVTIAPVQRPHLVLDGVKQTGNRETGSLRPKILAPRCAALNDRQVSGSDLALNADLVAGVLWHSLVTPAVHPYDVEVRQSHDFTDLTHCEERH